MSKGNILVSVAIAVVAVMVVAALGLLATKVWNPGWNPFSGLAKPSLAIDKAIFKLGELKTLKAQADIKAEIQTAVEGEQSNVVNVSLSFLETVDKTNSEEPKSSFDMALSLGAEGMNFEAKAQIITTAEDIYLKISQFPEIPFLGLEELAALKNQWFKIEQKKLMPAAAGELEKISGEELTKDLKTLIEEKQIFAVKKNLGKEDIDGIKTTHYLTSLNKQTLKDIIPKFLALGAKYIPEKDRSEYEKDREKLLADFPEKFDEIWQKIQPLEFEFWLDAAGNLRKTKFAKELDLEKLGVPDEQGKLKLVFEAKLFDFNKEVAISVPTEYKPIEELLPAELLSPSELLEPSE